MKFNLLTLLGLIALCIFPYSGKSQTNFQPAMGIAIKASSTGFGGDLVFAFREKVNFRLGMDKLGYDRTITFSENDIEYEADVKLATGSISLLCDISLGKWFFISGGVGYNLFHSEVIGHAISSFPFGDIEIPKEKIGEFHFNLDPGVRISPYLGIGLGQTLNTKKRVAFAFELGGFYQGPPDISIESTGLLSPTANPDQGQENKLERQIDQYYIYPMLKFSLSFRIVSF